MAATKRAQKSKAPMSIETKRLATQAEKPTITVTWSHMERNEAWVQFWDMVHKKAEERVRLCHRSAA